MMCLLIPTLIASVSNFCLVYPELVEGLEPTFVALLPFSGGRSLWRRTQIDDYSSHPCGLLDPLIHFEDQENFHIRDGLRSKHSFPRVLILLSRDIYIFEYRCPFKAHTKCDDVRVRSSLLHIHVIRQSEFPRFDRPKMIEKVSISPRQINFPP